MSLKQVKRKKNTAKSIRIEFRLFVAMCLIRKFQLITDARYRIVLFLTTRG